MDKKNLKLFVILAVLVLMLSACGDGATDTSGDTAASSNLDKVTVQLSWFHTSSSAMFYLADSLGYYEDAGIEVEIVQGGYTAEGLYIESSTEVAAGTAMFGTMTGEKVIASALTDTPLIAVGNLLTRSPNGFAVLRDSGINSPADFAGKTMGVSALDMSTSLDKQALVALGNVGIDINSINLTNITEYNVNPLKSGEYDIASGAWHTNYSLAFDEVDFFFLEDYGVAFYQEAIATTQALYDENPDLVRRFISATYKGFFYMLEHKDEAVAATMTHTFEGDEAFEAAQLTLLIPLWDTGTSPVGVMDASVWEATEEMLFISGLISEHVDVSQVWTNEFTSQ